MYNTWDKWTGDDGVSVWVDGVGWTDPWEDEDSPVELHDEK